MTVCHEHEGQSSILNIGWLWSTGSTGILSLFHLTKGVLISATLCLNKIDRYSLHIFLCFYEEYV